MDGNGTTAPAQGAPAADAQAGAPAQGAPAQGQPTGDAKGDFWGNFPDVPEEHRSLLEPHLKNVQGHVTKLEQSSAPWRQLQQAGIEPQQVASLVQFQTQLQQNPLGTWLQLAQQLQKNGVLNNDLDLEEVAAVAMGQHLEDDGAEGEGEGGDPEVSALKRQLAQMQQAMMQEKQSAQRSQVEQQQDAALATAMGEMRDTLIEAGYPEDAVTDEALVGSIIANKGDQAAAIASLTGLRDSVLKGVGNGNGRAPLEMPKGTPKAPGGDKKPPRDAFEGASNAAEQMLRARNQEAAQG